MAIESAREIWHTNLIFPRQLRWLRRAGPRALLASNLRQGYAKVASLQTREPDPRRSLRTAGAI